MEENANENITENGEQQQYSRHFTNCYDIVSKVAYLIGVSEYFFELDNGTFDRKQFESLNQNRNARIIRNLCIIRSSLMRNYQVISDKMNYQMKNINSLGEHIDAGILNQLTEDGVSLWHANWKASQYIIFISDEIKKKISSCHDLFPIWIEWDYIRELFVVHSLKTERDINRIVALYQGNISYYPYQMFINWQPSDNGNILYNDEKFIVHTLYPMHRQEFRDLSKVRNASEALQNDISYFLRDSDRNVIVVDCENSNPYKLYSMLDNLSSEELEKIRKIILYNDIHTSAAWKLLKRFVSGVEHKMIPRVKDNKSLVDISLAVGTCKEYYEGNTTSFILVSSDSDYWGLIKGLPACRFLVLIEKDKTSAAIKSAMDENGIVYASIDDFCSGNLEAIQSEALLLELKTYLRECEIDMNSLIDKALFNIRSDLSENEKVRFKQKYIGKLRITKDNGIIRFEF